MNISRRELITLLGGAAAVWPVAAGAQEIKRVGVLMNGTATNPNGQSNLASFKQGLRKLGWIEGQNVRIEVRWNSGDANLAVAYANDLVRLLRPDVLLTATTANLNAVRRVTSTIPVVFTQIRDPVEQGIVPNLTHPGGNITGFANTEFSIAGKWADLLKQIAPQTQRIVAIFNPETSPQSKFYLTTVEAAAPSLGLEVMTTPVHSPAEIASTLARLSRELNIGLIFFPDGFTVLHAKLIVETVARYRLPAIYGNYIFMAEGALMHYGNDLSEPYRLAPFYVDRILKGIKPGDLPVQLPTRFKFIVNRQTAAALGIDLPLGLLLAADEVIE